MPIHRVRLATVRKTSEFQCLHKITLVFPLSPVWDAAPLNHYRIFWSNSHAASLAQGFPWVLCVQTADDHRVWGWSESQAWKWCFDPHWTELGHVVPGPHKRNGRCGPGAVVKEEDATQAHGVSLSGFLPTCNTVTGCGRWWVKINLLWSKPRPHEEE